MDNCQASNRTLWSISISKVSCQCNVLLPAGVWQPWQYWKSHGNLFLKCIWILGWKDFLFSYTTLNWPSQYLSPGIILNVYFRGNIPYNVCNLCVYVSLFHPAWSWSVRSWPVRRLRCRDTTSWWVLSDLRSVHGGNHPLGRISILEPLIFSCVSLVFVFCVSLFPSRPSFLLSPLFYPLQQPELPLCRCVRANKSSHVL